MFDSVYRGKTVLVTGHAGFKGGWLVLWLKLMGAKVVGYSLLPDTEKRLYDILNLSSCLDDSAIADICDKTQLVAYFCKHNPDIVFHLAAQSLVRLSYLTPVETYETNVIGTLKVLEAARKTPSVKGFVNVTTDKCYENREDNLPYRENDQMGGYDPYSSSKGCSELLTSSYRRSFLSGGKPFALGSGRAGNVIGGGDWAQGRLIPDIVRACVKGEAVVLRNPHAVRPWQFVLEPLAGYLRLGQKLLEDEERCATAYNFGPRVNENIEVVELVAKVVKSWGCGKMIIAEDSKLHESELLRLNVEKAERELGVAPVYTLDETVVRTVEWYKKCYEGETDMVAYSQGQIENFVAAARGKNFEWADESQSKGVVC